MNTYGVIILATLLGEYLLSTAADFLNLGTITRDLPKEFGDVFDSATYRKSQEYTRAGIQLEMVSSTFGLAVILLFWFSGGFEVLDETVRSWNAGVLGTGMVYVGLLLLARSILFLPFTIYSTFVLEERFGFNKTTPVVFIMDLLKGLVLACILGGPLLCLVLWLFQAAGSLAWVYGWIGATMFIFFVQFIAPTWIMPLFNKFTPLGEGALRSAILTTAESSGFPVQDVFVMDGSKRSTKSNAFFTGFGRTKRIALYDTIIGNHTTDELVSIVAHEIGHYKLHHIVQGIVIAILQSGVMLCLLSMFIASKGLLDAFYVEHLSVYAGMIFFGMLFGPLEFFLSLFMHSLSRKNEFAADRFAAEQTKNPRALIAALKKLSSDNLAHLTPHPFYVALRYSHPTMIERIRALQKFV
ncbi:MAG TPA: M48 family metallopeptidase [Bacteroidota bacterium]|nr:M48 family metallopeptidase [Bacteroidota bacterium]